MYKVSSILGLIAGISIGANVVAAGPEQLAGSEWRPIEIAGQTQPASTKLFINFGGNGKASGHGGCNRIFGSYTNDKVNLELGPIGATRMACAPDVMAREAAFIKALASTRLFLRDATKLTLKTAQGVTTLRLVQTDWD